MLNKLKWYYSRMKLMNIEEIVLFRLPQLIQIYIYGHFQLRQNIKLLPLNEDFNTPTYRNEDISQLFCLFPFNNKYRVFTEVIDVFNFKEWRKDVSSSIVSPIKYYGNINRQDFCVNGDVKFVSEISRMEFLPFITLKFIESKDNKYLTCIERILKNWKEQNPYLKTINWTSGIEIGLRSVNLVYTHIILRQFEMLSCDIDTLIKQQLSSAYYFLKNHLSLYSSANNHLMAELMGLNVIASYLNVKENERKRWREMFFKEIENQINGDGVHMELCTRYHAEVTDQILIGLTYIMNSGEQVPEKIWLKLKKLFIYTEHVDYYGNETIFGDNDEGSVINPYFVDNFSLYNSQLATSNYLFNTNYKSSENVDFRNYLIFGSEFTSIEYKEEEKDILFKESGYCFMYDHSTKTKLSFDCGSIGDKISAAHGHSDIFHFNLEVNGVPFLIDSGTFQYHTKYEKLRNYFKGITAHNTISINEENHATNNGRMSWVNCPNIKIDEFNFTEQESYCKATTNAFKQSGVQHTRAIRFMKNKQKVLMKDILLSHENKNKKLSFYLHFHPDVVLRHKDNYIEAVNSDVKIIINNKHFINTCFFKGNENIPLGWFSSKFNSMEETNSLLFEMNMSKSLVLETVITYG